MISAIEPRSYQERFVNFMREEVIIDSEEKRKMR